jgi:divalent metal cation (Fe/Co/Zn/Cd) transporter
MIREKLGGLLAGIVFLAVSIVIFYLDFVEGMWEGTEFDWLGLISAVFAFVLAVWVIQDSLKTNANVHKNKGNYNDSPTNIRRNVSHAGDIANRATPFF